MVELYQPKAKTTQEPGKERPGGISHSAVRLSDLRQFVYDNMSPGMGILLLFTHN